MTPIPTNKKLFQTTPITLSRNWDDEEGRDSFDGNSIFANSIATIATTTAVSDGCDDVNETEFSNGNTVKTGTIEKEHTDEDACDVEIETSESMSPSCLITDDKRKGASRFPPVPKAKRFFQSAPLDNSISGNSLLSSARSSASGLPPKPDGRISSQGDISERSRESLRSTLSTRKHSLTHQEAKFLEALIRNGTEIDIQKAYEKLLDEELFFDPLMSISSSYNNDSSYKADSGSSSNVDFQRSSYTFTRVADFPDLPTIATAPSCTENPDEINRVRSQSIAGSQASSNNAFGSEKRHLHLSSRRNSVTQKIWTAHENGLAVSTIASRRSVAQRLENSGNSASSSGIARGSGYSRRERWYSHLQKGAVVNDSIFRAKRPTSPTEPITGDDSGKTLDDIRSDNNRRTSRRFRRSLYASNFGHLGRRNSCIAATTPVPQSLRRLKSETSINAAKSVTFAVAPSPLKNERRTESDGAFDLTNAKKESTSENIECSERSVSSIPSLHLGTEVKSPSSTASDSNRRYPSIHLANEVWSPSSSVVSGSFSRFPTIHLAQGVLSDETGNDINEEKKSTDPSDYFVEKASQKLASAQTDNGQFMIQEASIVLGAEATVDEDDAIKRTVILRRASTSDPNCLDGIEVADWETELKSPRNIEDSYPDFCVVGSSTVESWHRTNSFDDSLYLTSAGLSSNICTNSNSIFRHGIRRSLSDESFGVRAYTSRTMLMDDSLNSVSIRDMMHVRPLEDDSANILSEVSWRMDEREDEDDASGEGYDAWKVIEDEYENGYGGGGTLPFLILGTSADDVDSHPHVLSPPLMESLLAFVPYGKSSDNFWMKFSLVRDGASFYSFLQYARGAQASFLAVETVDGEVFGAFTSTTWRKNWNYFGSGESFLWRMKHTRLEKSHSIIDQAQMESEIEVFPFTGYNSCIQLCVEDRIAVGGGNLPSKGMIKSSESNDDNDDGSNSTIPTGEKSPIKDSDWGFGLTIESDFTHGTSSPCLTFGSPSLSTIHHDGSLFEIMNIELWALTPCDNVDEAEKLELSRLFLEKHLHVNI